MEFARPLSRHPIIQHARDTAIEPADRLNEHASWRSVGRERANTRTFVYPFGSDPGSRAGCRFARVNREAGTPEDRRARRLAREYVLKSRLLRLCRGRGNGRAAGSRIAMM